MLDVMVSFLREQGILILMGLMLFDVVLGQVLASKRYGGVCRELRLLAGLQESAPSSPEKKKRRSGRRSERPEAVAAAPSEERVRRSEEDRAVEVRELRGQKEQLDAQLLYLKQSLDRIAAGRDQKLEEEVREPRKLTPEQEKIIAEILQEYLS